MVEIARAVSADAEIIILDEPTACLTDREKDKLFEVVRALKARGVSLIYISHRLEEIAEIGDVITVLRDGKVVASRLESPPVDELIRLMVGREVDELFPKHEVEAGEEVLRVENLNRDGVLESISFSVRAGEIVGLAGLVGAGRTELARAVFGADPVDSGKILVDGKAVEMRSPSDAISAGIGYLSEDRKLLSLALGMSIRANTTFAALEKFCTGPVISRRRELAAVRECMSSLAIRARHTEQKVKFLSGGNQQKVVVARWTISDSRVLFFDEPASGVDVAAKVEIFQLMNSLVKQGKAVIFISSYLPEVLSMCDRVMVMCRGRITAELPRSEATPEKVLYYSTIGGDTVQGRRRNNATGASAT
jgi:ribose transport system ATP-binding protein